MFEIEETEEFTAWFDRLADKRTRGRIAARLERLAQGLLGDVKPVGEGVSELRIDTGPGYRIYFIRRGSRLYVLLCAGDKDSQKRDIERAKQIARSLKGGQ